MMKLLIKHCYRKTNVFPYIPFLLRIPVVCQSVPKYIADCNGGLLLRLRRLRWVRGRLRSQVCGARERYCLTHRISRLPMPIPIIGQWQPDSLKCGVISRHMSRLSFGADRGCMCFSGQWRLQRRGRQAARGWRPTDQSASPALLTPVMPAAFHLKT